MFSAAHAEEPVRQGDVLRGQQLYQGCMGCHSLDDNDVGPMHRGVVGRRAGSVPDYAYSVALKSAGFIWNAERLDHWLANPQTLVPGTKMYYTVPDAQDRADLIAFLASQKPAAGNTKR